MKIFFILYHHYEPKSNWSLWEQSTTEDSTPAASDKVQCPRLLILLAGTFFRPLRLSG